MPKDKYRKIRDFTVQGHPVGCQRQYNRETCLPRLIALDFQQIFGNGAVSTQEIITQLRQALRREGAKGRAGHWSYNLSKHMEIIQALREEEANVRNDKTAPRSVKALAAVHRPRIRHKKSCPAERDSVFANFKPPI